MELQHILILSAFIVLLMLMATLGICNLFYTHQMIDLVAKIYRRIKVFGIEPYWDPHGGLVVSTYKLRLNMGFRVLGK